MIKYGLISETDARTLEKTIDLILEQFQYNVENHFVCVIEVGCYGGDSGRGLSEYIKSKNRIPVITGVDNFRDQHPISKDFNYDIFIQGNSSEVYNQVKDESQHLVFIDANHTFPAVIADFFCYKNKLKKGAFMAFHDVAVHLEPLSGWQKVGDKNDSDFCLGGVRRALKEIGLLDNKFEGWEFVMEDADKENEGGGIAIFRRK